MRPAAAPFDPLRVLKAMLGVVEAGPPKKFDQALVVVDETDDLIVDRDRPTAVKAGVVDDYRGTHPSRLAHGDVKRRPTELRRVRPARTINAGGGSEVSRPAAWTATDAVPPDSLRRV